jgi:uncharacterized protein (UPF0218 family)
VPGDDVVLELPESLRSELKEPLGPIYTDTERLLSDATLPIVAVGDIVTYHLLAAGHTPAVALADERTKRTDVEESIRAAVLDESPFAETVGVENPPGTITDSLVRTLVTALDREPGATTLIVVGGEEDLAALPAVLAVADGASVVYGQPDEGMVLVTADDGTRKHVRSLLERMDGDSASILALLAE